MKTLKGKRTTAKIQLCGQPIRCPKCEGVTTVYHLNWSAILCSGCKQFIDKNDWLVVESKDD